MTINVNVQYNGGLLPDIILLIQSMLLPSGNLFKCHEDVLYLQPIDFTVDEGKEWLNPSRDKNQGTHRRRKVD